MQAVDLMEERWRGTEEGDGSAESLTGLIHAMAGVHLLPGSQQPRRRGRHRGGHGVREAIYRLRYILSHLESGQAGGTHVTF